MIYLQGRALDPKKSIRDFELFVAGSFYHSDLSPLFPFPKGISRPRSNAPAQPLHPLTRVQAPKQTHGSDLITKVPVPYFPLLTRLKSLLPCTCSNKTSTPTPCPIPNQFLLTIFPFKINTILPVIQVPKVK